jgi:Cytosine/uracil/thiamine/allantoin permeases
MIPSAWYIQAQRFRTHARLAFKALFSRADVLIAPATPRSATLIGEQMMEINGQPLPVRASMPNTQNAQQGKAADSSAVYSPRLCNEDLAPTRDQNWSWYNIFSFWMSDVHSMAAPFQSSSLSIAQNTPPLPRM